MNNLMQYCLDNRDETFNIPQNILDKVGRNLYKIENHPISIIKNMIYTYFDDYDKLDDMSPIVSTHDNFDVLLIKEDHPSRSVHDTYYINSKTVLRTQTTAHQRENLLNNRNKKVLMFGDVYRKDEINCTHFPVFHQVDGYCLLDVDVDAELELRKTLSGLVEYLFPGCEYRYNVDSFPFTIKSLEVEVKFNDQWMEILGCGVIHPQILEETGHINGFAFGLGIERLAMILFKITDIRKFWCNDDKFLSQFKENQITEFKPYSVLDVLSKDISFFIDDEYILVTIHRL
jgi:phenylalanyl-tRNA synthetase alpha chain